MLGMPRQIRIVLTMTRQEAGVLVPNLVIVAPIGCLLVGFFIEKDSLLLMKAEFSVL